MNTFPSFSDFKETATNEAMVQVAGKNKPSGAHVLATLIIDHMIKQSYLKPGADAATAKDALVDDLKKLIMDSTF